MQTMQKHEEGIVGNNDQYIYIYIYIYMYIIYKFKDQWSFVSYIQMVVIIISII